MKKRVYWVLVLNDPLSIVSELLCSYDEAVAERNIWKEDLPDDKYTIQKVVVLKK